MLVSEQTSIIKSSLNDASYSLLAITNETMRFAVDVRSTEEYSIVSRKICAFNEPQRAWMEERQVVNVCQVYSEH